MSDARFTFRRDGTVEYDGMKIGRVVSGKDRAWGSRAYKPSYAAYDALNQRIVNDCMRPNFWVRLRAAEKMLELHRKKERG